MGSNLLISDNHVSSQQTRGLSEFKILFIALILTPNETISEGGQETRMCQVSRMVRGIHQSLRLLRQKGKPETPGSKSDQGEKAKLKQQLLAS